MYRTRPFLTSGRAAALTLALLVSAGTPAIAADVDERLARTWVQEGRKAFSAQSQIYVQNLHALGKAGPEGPRQVRYAVIYDRALPREGVSAYQRTVGTYEFDCQGKYRVLRRQHETLDGRIVAKVETPDRWWPATALSTAEAHVCGRATSPLAAGEDLDGLTRRFLQARNVPLPETPEAALRWTDNNDPEEMQGDRWTVLSASAESAGLVEIVPLTDAGGPHPQFRLVMIYPTAQDHAVRRAVGTITLDCPASRVRGERTDGVHIDGRVDETVGADQGEWTSVSRDAQVIRTLCADRSGSAAAPQGFTVHELTALYLQWLRLEGHAFEPMPLALEYCPVEFEDGSGKRYYASSALAPVAKLAPNAGLAAWAAKKAGVAPVTPPDCVASSSGTYVRQRAHGLAGFHERAFANGQTPVVLTEEWRPGTP